MNDRTHLSVFVVDVIVESFAVGSDPCFVDKIFCEVLTRRRNDVDLDACTLQMLERRLHTWHKLNGFLICVVRGSVDRVEIIPTYRDTVLYVEPAVIARMGYAANERGKGRAWKLVVVKDRTHPGVRGDPVVDRCSVEVKEQYFMCHGQVSSVVSCHYSARALLVKDRAGCPDVILWYYLSMQYNFAPFKQKVADTVAWLSNELSGIHTGRATPAILDHVSIESYGSRMAVPHVAGITIEDARTLRVAPWDKGQIKDIEKAVYDANLGLSVSVDADGLRIIFPELTTERRTQFVKIARAKLEDARIALRAEREKVSSDITEQERDGNMSEDEKFRAKDELQKLVDEGNSKLEAVADKKETEIMG